MIFGNYKVYPIEMGDFLLDGGAMFGIVPKVMWNKKIPADEANRIPMKGRALLVMGEGRNILVDTGCGSKLNDKLSHIYGISHTPPSPDESLETYGLSASDITDVILTHLHFDHAGGATCLEGDAVVPSYPNARYYVSRIQWEWAQSPSSRDRASYFPENYMPLMDHGVLTLIEPEQPSPLENIRLLNSDGHTPGQLLPVLESGGKTLFYCGDLIPTSAHIPVPWHMGYDNSPLVLLKEKEELLKKAADEHWILFFEHDPVVTGATVQKGDRGYEPGRVISKDQWVSA